MKTLFLPRLASMLGLVVLLFHFSAAAIDLVVNNTGNAGFGTLRQALQDNNSLGGGNTVVFVGGAVGTITLTSGELLIGTNVTIIGPGADVLTVSGNNVSRALRVTNAVASISGLSFVNGFTGSGNRGGGIHNASTLTLSNCVVANCVGGIGGGIWNQGALLIGNSVVRNNSSAGSSGGIANTGTLGLVGSSVMNNVYTGFTPGDASGIYGGARITNCTVAGNSGAVGAITSGNYTIRNSTISSNSGLGVYLYPSEVSSASVGNCIIAGNTFSSDVNGIFTSAGYNLIGRTNGSSGWGAVGDQFGTAASPLNPKLLAPGLYGGTTPTMPPAPGSPAIDQGQNFGVLVDQRGRPRPFDQITISNVPSGDGTDIGAVELSPTTRVVANTNDNGAGSLRQAIASAASVDSDLITFATNVVGNIGLTTGELVIGKSLSIQGSTTVSIAINGNNTNRIFHIASNSIVTISLLTITNAKTAADGGAMYNEFGCTLVLSNCAVVANISGGNGGGLANNGNFAAYNCTFSGNQAGLNAGAIYTYAGPVTLRSCTVVSNTAVSANGTGGGILNYSLVAGTSNNLGNTIVAGNAAASHPDVIGVFTSSGYNLIGKIDYSTQIGGGANGVTTSGLTNGINHDQVGSIGVPINPLLGPLQANGGSTLMMAPLPGSPAIDQGNSPGLPTDQRGRLRPNDNPTVVNAVGGDGSDIGAVEISPLTLIVANTNDIGAGSLRQTVLDAAAGDTINFAPNVTGAITFSNNAVTLSQDVTIQGPGARVLAINGSTNNHIFSVNTGVVVIADLTLSNGRSINGGGIQLGGGALTLSNCVVSGNSANTNSGSGGGIKASGGSLVVLNSTLSGNEARFGGGIWNCCALVAITNSTFTANQAIGGNGSDGGAIHNSGTLIVQSCTIVSNSAGGGINAAGGGGIRNFNVAHVGNSIIANNRASAAEPDAGGVFISDGYNFIGARTGSNGDGFTNGVSQDQVGTTNTPLDPLLGPLQDNGGPTPTMALQAGSPALDQGKSSLLTTDQRGAPRPFDFASSANAASGDGTDIGAFESGSPQLAIQSTGIAAVLSWPSYYGDFTLQSTTNVVLANAWTAVAGTPVVRGYQYLFTNSPITGTRFYRLQGN